MMKDSSAKVIGLDVGTSRLVAARKEGSDFKYESQLNAFVNLPFSKVTENVLRSEKIPFTVGGKDITVFGNEAARFAELLNVEVRRPMTRGVLNPQEPESLAQIRRIVTALLGEDGDGRKVCYSIPAPPPGCEENLTYHEASLRQMLADIGCETQSINEGMAVIYSELQDTNFTGVGVSCGGGLCNVALAYMSVPVLSFCTPKGGDFVDSSAASVTGELANRIRMVKETGFHFNGHYPDKVQQVLSVYYDEMILSIIQGLRDAFEGTRTVPRIPRPIPLVLSGGSCTPPGFKERFGKLLEGSTLPVQFSEIRVAADPLTSTARGALVAGMAE
ncbi:MAG: hypothetical protein ABI693_09720 [Bryobacteraceae bacterium]